MKNNNNNNNSTLSDQVSDPTKRMTSTYIVSLGVIAFLSIVVHFMLDRIIEEQGDSAVVISISGEQRLLSQRISLLTLDYLASGDLTTKQMAQDALVLMKKNHELLLKEHHQASQNNVSSPLSAQMNSLYFDNEKGLSPQIEQFTFLINQALRQDPSQFAQMPMPSEFRFWHQAKHDLYSTLDKIVKQYELEGLQKVKDLKSAQRLVLLIIILTLLIEALFIFRPMVNRVAKFAERLQKEANHDHLTGLLNRRSFSIFVNKSWALSKRYGHQMSIITYDIDNFKLVNDDYGHDVGDKALRHVSQLIQENTRESDCVARLGGEEFVVMLPQTNKHDAKSLADKIRLLIEKSPLDLEAGTLALTVSAGISEFVKTDDSIDDILKRSDQALYSAKKQGRNKVSLA
ncbi:GGDEF domain-containing protein [Paraglaciecola aestuariivivens]